MLKKCSSLFERNLDIMKKVKFKSFKDDKSQITTKSRSLDLFEVDGLTESFGSKKSKNRFTKTYSEERELVYGVHPVYLALKANLRKHFSLYYKHGSDVREKIQIIISLAKERNIPITSVNNKWLKNVFKDEIHQGVCLESSFIQKDIFSPNSSNALDLESYIRKQSIETAGRELWLYLDAIQDPMNLGSIIRSSYFFGANKILIGVKDCCKITPVVSKASSGVAEIFPLTQVSNFANCIPSLKKNGWSIISSVSETTPNAITIDTFKPEKKSLLVLGNEQTGISEEIKTASDLLITIPARRSLIHDLSLNVSTAASILIYSILSKS